MTFNSPFVQIEGHLFLLMTWVREKTYARQAVINLRRLTKDEVSHLKQYQEDMTEECFATMITKDEHRTKPGLK